MGCLFELLFGWIPKSILGFADTWKQSDLGMVEHDEDED